MAGFKIYLNSVQYGLNGVSIYEEANNDMTIAFDAQIDEEPEKIEFMSDAEVLFQDGRIIIKYDESSIYGMEGCSTVVSFEENVPEIVCIERNGIVESFMVLEERVHHTADYKTPFMNFNLAVFARKVVNKIDRTGGFLEADYIVEIRGASAQRTVMRLEVRPECTIEADK